MIWVAPATYRLEPGEPAIRTCWECNGAHQHLRFVTNLHLCIVCGRNWILGHYLNEFHGDNDAFERLLRELGLKYQQSTTLLTVKSS